MLRDTFLTVLAAVMLSFAGCRPEEEPFEFPDNEISEPSTYYHMIRLIGEDETWQQESVAEGCSDDFPESTFAITEVSDSRGFLSLFLVPDTSACSASATVSTEFTQNEIAPVYWDNLKVELAFSELQLNPFSELRFALDYREISLDLDLAPYFRQILLSDTQVVDASGLFVILLEAGEVVFKVNEFDFQPDFSEGSGNQLSLESSAQQSDFKLSMTSSNTDERSLIVVTLFRASSFGIPQD